MKTYEIQHNGKTYEVQANSPEEAANAVQGISPQKQPPRPQPSGGGNMLSAFNRGLTSVAGMFVDPAAVTYNAVANRTALPPIEFPGGRSENAMRHSAQAAGIDTREMPGVVGKAVEYTGASLPFAMLGPAPQLLGRVGSEVLSSTGAAVGEQLGRSIMDSETGATIGNVAGGLTPAGLAGAARGIMRGGPAAGAEMRARVNRFGQQGIDPSLSQATGSRTLGTVESGLASTFGGTGVAREFGIRQQGQAQNALINAVGAGALDKNTAGRMIREGVFGDEGYVELARAKTRANYDQVWSVADPESLDLSYSTRTLIDNLPKDDSLAGLFVAPKLRNVAATVQKSGPISVGELDEARKQIGHLLGDPVMPGDVNISRRDLKRLYAALSDDIERNIERQSPEALAAFKTAKREFQKHMVYMDGLVNKLAKIDADEKIFDAVAGGRNPDTAVLSQAKGVLNESEWKTFVRTLTNRMGAIQPSQELPELTFSTESFLTSFNRIRREAPEALDIMYGRGQYRGDLERIATSFEDMRRSKVYTNPSQSAGTGIVAASLQAIPMVLGSAAAGAAAASGQGGMAAVGSGLAAIGAGYYGTRAMSNTMHNQKLINWLARSTEISPQQYAAHISRLRAMGEGEEKTMFNELADAITEMLPNGN